MVSPPVGFAAATSNSCCETRLRQNAKKHSDLAAIYEEKHPFAVMESKLGDAFGQGARHCKKFAELAIEQAKEADALVSVLHENMAKAAEQKQKSRKANAWPRVFACGSRLSGQEHPAGGGLLRTGLRVIHCKNVIPVTAQDDYVHRRGIRRLGQLSRAFGGKQCSPRQIERLVNAALLSRVVEARPGEFMNFLSQNWFFLIILFACVGMHFLHGHHQGHEDTSHSEQDRTPGIDADAKT